MQKLLTSSLVLFQPPPPSPTPRNRKSEKLVSEWQQETGEIQPANGTSDSMSRTSDLFSLCPLGDTQAGCGFMFSPSCGFTLRRLPGAHTTPERPHSKEAAIRHARRQMRVSGVRLGPLCCFILLRFCRTSETSSESENKGEPLNTRTTLAQ